VILGRGRLREALTTLAGSLGVDRQVDLPGFVENPYPFIRRARAFVLSSRWEGSPNVLVEALALGTPVVATDCPSGPREILAGGRFGPLVPVGDPEALAEAILGLLRAPPDPTFLRSATAEYTVEVNARRYQAILARAVAGEGSTSAEGA
jgi:glycosyltransferase involved in cell wall biosynthesis